MTAHEPNSIQFRVTTTKADGTKRSYYFADQDKACAAFDRIKGNPKYQHVVLVDVVIDQHGKIIDSDTISESGAPIGR
jgi:hypothetical protein